MLITFFSRSSSSLENHSTTFRWLLNARYKEPLWRICSKQHWCWRTRLNVGRLSLTPFLQRRLCRRPRSFSSRLVILAEKWAARDEKEHTEANLADYKRRNKQPSRCLARDVANSRVRHTLIHCLASDKLSSNHRCTSFFRGDRGHHGLQSLSLSSFFLEGLQKKSTFWRFLRF